MPRRSGAALLLAAAVAGALVASAAAVPPPSMAPSQQKQQQQPQPAAPYASSWLIVKLKPSTAGGPAAAAAAGGGGGAPLSAAAHGVALAQPLSLGQGPAGRRRLAAAAEHHSGSVPGVYRITDGSGAAAKAAQLSALPGERPGRRGCCALGWAVHYAHAWRAQRRRGATACTCGSAAQHAAALLPCTRCAPPVPAASLGSPTSSAPLAPSAEVEWAVPDFQWQPLPSSQPGTAPGGGGAGSLRAGPQPQWQQGQRRRLVQAAVQPNDPLYLEKPQWHLPAVSAPQAWALTGGAVVRPGRRWGRPLRRSAALVSVCGGCWGHGCRHAPAAAAPSPLPDAVTVPRGGLPLCRSRHA